MTVNESKKQPTPSNDKSPHQTKPQTSASNDDGWVKLSNNDKNKDQKEDASREERGRR